jgi:hypothetical protein
VAAENPVQAPSLRLKAGVENKNLRLILKQALMGSMGRNAMHSDDKFQKISMRTPSQGRTLQYGQEPKPLLYFLVQEPIPPETYGHHFQHHKAQVKATRELHLI